MRRHLRERELVRAEPQRGLYRRIQLGHRAAAERLDPVVERPDPLNRAVGQPLRKGAIPRLEAGRSGGKGAVGVGGVLENATDGLVGGTPSRRDAHLKPRKNSS